jgi:hypothetical protein
MTMEAFESILLRDENIGAFERSCARRTPLRREHGQEGDERARATGRPAVRLFNSARRAVPEAWASKHRYRRGTFQDLRPDVDFKGAKFLTLSPASGAASTPGQGWFIRGKSD